MIKVKWEKELIQTRIGKIPKDWKIVHIGELAEFTNGFSYKGSEKSHTSKGYVFVTLNNVVDGGGFKKDYSWIESTRIKERHFLKEGDLVIANTHFGVGGSGFGRLLGTPAIVIFPDDYQHEKGVYSHHITKISPKDPVFRAFLYWYLVATQEESANFHTGTTVKGLDIASLKRNKQIVIPLPAEQNYIPTVLSWFSDLIENKKRQNEIFENVVLAIFKNWFIDFEPFKEREFVQSEFGKIPKEFEVRKLHDLLLLLRDGTHNPPKRVDVGVPLLVSKHVKKTGIDFEGITRIRMEDYMKIHRKYQPEQNDIVFTKIGIIGETTILGKEDLPLAVHCNVALIRANRDKIDPLYLLYYLRSSLFNEQLQGRVQRTAQEFLPLNKIAELPVLLPPKLYIERFRSIVEPLFQKMILNQRQIAALKKILRILLFLLVFGKLRIEEF